MKPVETIEIRLTQSGAYEARLLTPVPAVARAHAKTTRYGVWTTMPSWLTLQEVEARLLGVG